MTNELIQDANRILKANGVTKEAVAKSMREFYENHSYNKMVVRSYIYDELIEIYFRSSKIFMKTLKMIFI